MSASPSYPGKLSHLPRAGTLPVPWVAIWSEEEGTACLTQEIYGGKPFVCLSHRLARGKGRPILGKMSQVRQRRCILDGRCQVCGELMVKRYVAIETSHEDLPGYGPVLVEPPACATCARVALAVCPGLRGRGRFVEMLDSIPILQFIAPIGDPEKDAMFHPLQRADFPPNGAVGYIKYAVTRARPADLTPWGS